MSPIGGSTVPRCSSARSSRRGPRKAWKGLDSRWIPKLDLDTGLLSSLSPARSAVRHTLFPLLPLLSSSQQPTVNEYKVEDHPRSAPLTKVFAAKKRTPGQLPEPNLKHIACTLRLYAKSGNLVCMALALYKPRDIFDSSVP